MICIWRRPILASLAAVAGLTMILSGCAGFGAGRSREERDARVNVFPDNYKSDLLAALHSYVADPTNIRDAYLTDPAIKPVAARNRYVVCVRFNAKNSDGRYVGSKDIVAIFMAGRFDQFLDQTNQSNPAGDSNPPNPVKEICAQAEYKRFPELEAMNR